MKTSALLNRLTRPRFLWVVIFFYTLATGLFVQLILLPYIVTSWHAGNGLLLSMDGPEFHRIALEQSRDIETQGWNAWELRPEDQLVSGVASIFYVLIYPAPWSVLPFNALLNAFAGTGFYLLLCLLIGNEKKSLLAALPFIFFPSAMVWNTQFHNESYVVPGMVFILLGWLIIYTPKYRLTRIRPALGLLALALVALGSGLFVFARAPALLALTAFFLMCTLTLNAAWLWNGKKEEMGAVLYRVGLTWLACITMLIGLSISRVDRLRSSDENKPNKTTSDSTRRHNRDLYQNSVDRDEEPREKPRGRAGQNGQKLDWQQSNWLPEFVDAQFKALAESRAAFLRGAAGSGSLIDQQVVFLNAGEVLAYIPRALEIGMLSPFPNIWFEQGEEPGGSAMRLETALEMVFSYLCLLGLPIFAWKNRRKQGLLVLLLVCMYMLVLHAITNPNQGALYRFRYPYYMPMVCLGLAGWLTRADSLDEGLISNGVPATHWKVSSGMQADSGEKKRTIIIWAASAPTNCEQFSEC